MVPVKRHAYKAGFKLKAISYALEHGNRAAAREYNGTKVEKTRRCSVPSQKDKIKFLRPQSKMARIGGQN